MVYSSLYIIQQIYQMETARIKVAVRVRPFLPSETERGYQNTMLKVDANRKEVCYQYNDHNSRKAFSFDHVFGTQSSQQNIYSECQISQLVQKAMDGYHSTIFAYGQTGSGKTFTMQGKQDPESKLLDGIIPKAIYELFEKIQKCKSRTFVISVSFLQIYNERVFDLLNPISLKSGIGLKLRWNKNQQFSVENLFVYECKNSEQLLRHFVYGLKNRVNSSHKLNMSSSRSHSILTIKIQSFENLHPSRIYCSKIELVDLAGSERIGLTGAEGKLAKQSIDINKSLFTLRQVISTLADWGRKQKESTQHIPYRDSKLTSILKQSIGGNSYCLMIACVSPNDSFFEQNVSTLTYATKATMIINKPIINDDPNMKQIQELKIQVRALTEQLAKANRYIEMISDQKGVEGGGSSNKCKNHQRTDSANKPPQKRMSLNEIESESLSSSKPVLKKKMSTHLATGDYEQFSDRLVESINTVRELLKSNKELREQLEAQKESIDQKDVEIFNLQKQNQQLRQRSSPYNTLTNVFEETPPPLILHQASSKYATKTLGKPSKNRDSFNLISANITVHNFNTRPMNPSEAMNSVELKSLMNETGMDSMPTNFNKREVSTAKMNMSSRSNNMNNTIQRYRKTFTSKSKRHSMEAHSFLDARRSRGPFS